MTSKKCVLTAEWIHETNTFALKPTNYKSFQDRFLMFGDDAVAARKNSNTELAGFLSCGSMCDWEIIHVMSAAASPSGVIISETYEKLSSYIIDAVTENRDRLTGILLALHGAMVSQYFEDGEGELLRRIRSIVGIDCPMAITLDLHANVSEKMTTHANIIVSYKTYPHIDMKECGYRAASILNSAMLGQIIRPKTMLVRAPMLEEANGGRSDVGAMVARLQRVARYEAQQHAAGVLAVVSINAGFPTDIADDVGPTVLCTYDAAAGDETAAAHMKFIEELVADIWSERHNVVNSFLSVADVCATAVDELDRAKNETGSNRSNRPVIIADFADNPGAGAYGDSTALLSAMLHTDGLCDAVLAPLVDPQLAAQIHAARHVAGDVLPSLTVGGRIDPGCGGGPVMLHNVVVRCVSDGYYTGTGPMIGGLTLCFGKTVVLEVERNIEILVVSEPEQILDLAQLECFGIDPRRKKVVALKSMQHFRAAFEPIACCVLVCDSGALCTPDMRKLSFKHIRRPVFPLEDDFWL
jgi:microcystin degradation protein MlrC